jgi:hypothetical protein
VTATGISGQGTITGRIVNAMNAPLDSAKVWLKGNPSVFAYSRADGKVSLPVSGSPSREVGRTGHPDRGMSISPGEYP